VDLAKFTKGLFIRHIFCLECKIKFFVEHQLRMRTLFQNASVPKNAYFLGILDCGQTVRYANACAPILGFI
jgi:hypothetical protein